ncbi:hypothetical protein [Streptomyces sp. SYSU K217416]
MTRYPGVRTRPFAPVRVSGTTGSAETPADDDGTPEPLGRAKRDISPAPAVVVPPLRDAPDAFVINVSGASREPG